jgi:hypothetical protein
MNNDDDDDEKVSDTTNTLLAYMAAHSLLCATFAMFLPQNINWTRARTQKQMPAILNQELSSLVK